MDFFNRLANLDFEGNLTLVARKTPLGELVVSTFLHNPSVNDRAKKSIPPLTVCTTPDELDKGFFDSLQATIPKANTLLVSMANYEKGLAEASTKSAQALAQAQAEKKEKESQKTRFDALMKVVSELEAEEKYRQAYAKLPDGADLPLFASQIDAKRKELLAKFNQPSLFDAPLPAPTAHPQPEPVTH